MSQLGGFNETDVKGLTFGYRILALEEVLAGLGETPERVRLAVAAGPNALAFDLSLRRQGLQVLAHTTLISLVPEGGDVLV